MQKKTPDVQEHRVSKYYIIQYGAVAATGLLHIPFSSPLNARTLIQYFLPGVKFENVYLEVLPDAPAFVQLSGFSADI